MTQKFSQITASLANFTTADSLIGVQNGTADRLFTLAQIASGILTSPVIGGHATIEGVTLTGATGTGAMVFDHSPTLGTATINNSTLGTATINNSTLGTATINTATLNNATLNTATLNTATINTSTLNTPTINTATLNAPLINDAALSTATINTGTLNNVTINTGTFNNGVLNTATLNNPTISTAVIGTSTINNSTLGTATINNSTIGTAAINNSTINTGTFIASSLNLLHTISATQLGSAVDTTSLTSTYNRYRITFENVCPVSTATLTCSLNLQVATSGTSWISASYVSNVTQFVGGTTVLTGTTSLFLLSGLTATTCVGTSTIYGVNGYVDLINPASTVIRKSLRGELNYIAPGAVSTLTLNTVVPSGFWDGNSSAIVSIAVAFQTGNIATGTIRVYGIL